jgi:hypothetical protein
MHSSDESPMSGTRSRGPVLRHQIVAGWSGRDAVADVNNTIAEPALVEELEVGARVARKRGLTRADEYRMDEQLTLIDEPGIESVRGGFGPPTVRSLAADAFTSRIASGSKLRSSCVLAVDTSVRVVE